MRVKKQLAAYGIDRLTTDISDQLFSLFRYKNKHNKISSDYTHRCIPCLLRQLATLAPHGAIELRLLACVAGRVSLVPAYDVARGVND